MLLSVLFPDVTGLFRIPATKGSHGNDDAFELSNLKKTTNYKNKLHLYIGKICDNNGLLYTKSLERADYFSVCCS